MLKSLSSEQLVNEVKALIVKERQISRALIERIAEVDRRRLYLKFACSSLFDWMTRDLGYSSSAAFRRIEAARLLQRLPNVAEKIENGRLNLSTVAKVQTFVRQEEKRTGQKMALDQHTALLQKVEAKSSNAAEQILLQQLPLAAKMHDRVKKLDAQLTRLNLTLSEKQINDLKRVKELLSHRMPHASFAEIIQFLSENFLRLNDPLSKKMITLQQETDANCKKPNREGLAPKNKHKHQLNSARSNVNISPSPTAAAAVKQYRSVRSAIPSAIRRAVIQRDQSRCQWHHPVSGRVCGSRHRIEIDHILPVAKGGNHSFENLRCLCRGHNLFAAALIFGEAKVRNLVRKP